MNFLEWTLVIVGSVIVYNIVCIALWVSFISWRNRHLERINPLYAVDNHFASESAIAHENNAILRAKALLQ